MQAARIVKQEGQVNDLLERIKKDPYFDCIKDDLPSILQIQKFIGRADQQVRDFVVQEVRPVIQKLDFQNDIFELHV